MHPSAHNAAEGRDGRRGGRSGPRRTVRIIAELLAFTILVVSTALLLRPLQENILRRMVDLRDAVIDHAESRIGRRLEYRSMGPSIFGTLDLREISVIGDDGVAIASASRLRIGYSLIGLLRGEGFASVKAVSLDRPVFDIDMERDGDLIAFLTDRPRSPFETLPGGASTLSIRVRKGAVNWRGDGSEVHLSDVSLSATSSGDRIVLQSTTSVKAALAGTFGNLGSIQAGIRVKGELATSLSSGSLTLSLPSFSSDVARLRPQTILVVFSDGGAEFRKIKDKSPFDLSARYDAREGSWTIDLLMENFSLRDVLGFRGSLSDFDVWLGSRMSGSANLAFAKDGRSSYRFAITGDFPPIGTLGRSTASVSGAGIGSEVKLVDASIRTSRGEVAYKGSVAFNPFRPDGTLSLRGVRLRDGATLDTDLVLTPDKGDIAFFADRLVIGGVAFSAVDGRVRPEGTSYNFTVSALRFSGLDEYEDVRLAHFSVEGTFSGKDSFLQFSVSLDAFSAGEALSVARSFARLPPLAEARILDDISLTTEVFITTDFTQLSFNAPRLVAAYRGGADVFSVASVSGTDMRLDLRDARVIWKGGSIGGSASMDFQDHADISFSLSAEYRNIVYSANGQILDGHTVSFQGDYGLRGTLLIAERGNLSGFVFAEELPLPLGERRLSASLGASFRWAGIDAWSVALDELVIRESAGTDSLGVRASLRGSLDQDGAALPLLTIDDGQGSLSGSARLGWQGGFDSLTASVRLADDLGLERYEIEGALSPEGATVRLYLSKGRLERFFPNPYEAIATGELRLRWLSAANYEASWRVSEAKARLQGEEITVSGSGTLSPDTLDLENSKIAYSGFTADIDSLHIDRPARKADASFRIRGTAAGREADLVSRVNLSFASIPSWLSAQEAASTIEGVFDVNRARFGTLEADEPFKFSFAKESARFSLSGGPNDAIRFQTEAGGAFYLAFSAPAPLRGTLIGTIAGGQIDAGANNLYLDFPALWKLLPIHEVAFSGGIVIGSLTVRGPLGDPEFRGSARATGLRLSVPNWLEGEAGPAGADVVFTGDGFTFGPVAVPAGSGRAMVTGKFLLDRWIPTSFDLSIDVPQGEALHTKADVAGVVASGTASGNLRIERSDGEIGVTGLLTAESATIMMNPETFGIGRAEPLALAPYPVHVSLGLRTGRKVEFMWPSTDLPVLRVTAVAGNSLGVNYDGLSGRFALKGDVFLRGGEVFYFQRSFYVREGWIRFNENEVRMDPSLSVRAEIRDRYETGPVTIALIVDESPLSSFTPRLQADPVLSQLEIFSLLGQNLVDVDSQTGSASVQDSILLASSDLFAQFNVIRRFERTARDMLGLDMFSVRTQVLQNAVLDATGLRAEPVDRIGGLGNYFDNTTVYLGKYIGSDLFLQAMFSLQYEENKAENVFGGLRLEPDIGIELKTPLFLVRWSFLPEHPENIFVDDNSFTLTWKKSF